MILALTMPVRRYEQPANAGIGAAVGAFCSAVEAGAAPEPAPAFHGLPCPQGDSERADMGFFLMRLFQQRAERGAEQVRLRQPLASCSCWLYALRVWHATPQRTKHGLAGGHPHAGPAAPTCSALNWDVVLNMRVRGVMHCFRAQADGDQGSFVAAAMAPGSCTPDVLDYALSWHLHSALAAAGLWPASEPPHEVRRRPGLPRALGGPWLLQAPQACRALAALVAWARQTPEPCRLISSLQPCSVGLSRRGPASATPTASQQGHARHPGPGVQVLALRASFTAQLQVAGLPQWAAYVACSSAGVGPAARSTLCALLEASAPAWSGEAELGAFLGSRLKLPATWLAHARALWARHQQQPQGAPGWALTRLPPSPGCPHEPPAVAGLSGSAGWAAC